MSEITADSVYRLAGDLELTEVPDGRVIYQHTRERVHFLNPTAVIVLELCDLGRPVGAIEAFIAEAYGLATPPTETVRACIQSLVSEELLRPSTP